MGCDIHAVIQARVDGQWRRVDSKWAQERDYFLFSWLANVRNGFGFARVPTYEPIQPIALPRGLPPDFVVDESFYTPDETWLGDHSHSWLTFDEILNAHRPMTTRHIGVVDRADFEAWDGKTPFQSWCGWVSGRDVVVSESDSITPQTTHVRCEWTAPDGLDYFVDEIKRLRDLHGDGRVVFGFDS